MKVHFYLDRHKGKQVNLPVFLHFWNRGELLRVSTGEHCDSNDWNRKTERVKKHAAGAKETKRILDAQENELLRFVRKERSLGRPCTLYDLRQNLSFITGNKPGFFQVWDEFVSEHEKKNAWGRNTFESFRVLRNHLVALNEKHAVRFEAIDRKFMEHFVSYQSGKGLSQAYIRKNTDQLKWFLNWASIKGYNRNLGYKKFRNKRIDAITPAKQDIYLTPQELVRILNLKTGSTRTTVVRDAFCFACLTGLNYAELVQLKRKNVIGYQLTYNPKKTNRNLIVDLIDIPKKIADKYDKGTGKNLFSLPWIQVFNRTLKEIGEKAGIDEKITSDGSGEKKEYEKWQLLSSKASKRTFIKLGIGQGIGLEVMSELTGYAPSTLNKFYSVPKETLSREIKKLNLTTTNI